jgi:transaldolase
VSPDLANDTYGTLAEARQLWTTVARPNVMIKVPATPAGLPAIRTLISEGINVNVTLLFARDAYEAVAHAYIEGLEARESAGQPLAHVASVASFFVSRIDTVVDGLIDEELQTAAGADRVRLERLLGKVAIANAKLAYQSYKRIFAGPRWEALQAKSAQRQRVLWASTGSKNPHYSDVLYVEELIGPDTVNTVPPATLAAFRDHGRPRASLEEDVADAMQLLDDLERSGISLRRVTDDLLTDGVSKFLEPFTKLLRAVERRSREANTARINSQSHALPSALHAKVTERLKAWDADGGTRRLFAGDASLWTGTDEASWIGWLGIVDQQIESEKLLLDLSAKVRKEGFTHLEREARADGFRHIFPGVKSIGGRYSALSNFGMVPAAVMGLDVDKLLDEAERMLHACAPGVPADDNPGLLLGTILGVAATHGADKLTLISSPGIHDLGAWLEQLIAESTGKQDHGIIPVDRETVGAPSVYGNDRIFAYLRLEDGPDAAQDAAVASLEKAGKPVITIRVATKYDLAEEFVRWEIATAIAGAVMGINPFNQPDVEASKIATKSLTSEYEKTGKLPSEAPFFEGEGVKLFADPTNADALKSAVGSSPSLTSFLKAHLARLDQGDYFALLAYVEMNAAHEAALQRARHRVRDRKSVATCLGFGPRFLHSTGQAYKGGPNSGVFLQVTCEDGQDLQVPGQKYTFGLVKAAQARGDFQVLAERHRRALRIHLGPDVAAGLRALDSAIEQALA